ncbi:MAG: flotillin-like protein FloA [Planctomycetes bacterium]|nr:flotillin-like protein FloA [Planctomycetota bacterium]
MLSLFAQSWVDLADYRIWLIFGGMFVIVLTIIFLFVFLSFLNIWVQCVLTGADVSIWSLVWMKGRKVNYEMIVKQKIALVQAGVKIATSEMEAHFLAGGSVEKTALAVIAAHKANIDLSWATASAIDLAGRDVLDAVRTSVNPKVIECPDPTKGKATLEGVCKNGISLKARARVTVRTKLERLIGGATEETIIARVGEGIVEAIGAAEHHTDVLANPRLISQAVLKNALDSQTAFEIVSIDIAELDVGDNIGARLAAKKAESDLAVAQAQAEVRRAAAVAREQEMTALVEENRAKVVLAEAEVPLAIAQAFRDGNLGVGEYYNLRNIQSDTAMRNAIASTGKNSDNNGDGMK